MEANEKLKELFGKKQIKSVESGDHAILSVLQYAKSIGKEKVLIQDQGGWLTYRDYVKKIGLELVELKTDYGIIDVTDLQEKSDEKSVLLVNSLNGYFSEQPMEEIAFACAEKKCLLINDASGSIGTEIAKIGDIILCSFGKDKPVNLHYGGCIAYDTGEFEGEFDENRLGDLSEELDKLFVRLQEWEEINMKIKEDLKEFDIIHKDKHGINVVVKFSDKAEKEKIITYCKKNDYSYTLCPRYIRVNADAVSIEIKRKHFP
jgi:hypothetical protein